MQMPPAMARCRLFSCRRDAATGAARGVPMLAVRPALHLRFRHPSWSRHRSSILRDTTRALCFSTCAAPAPGCHGELRLHRGARHERALRPELLARAFCAMAIAIARWRKRGSRRRTCISTTTSRAPPRTMRSAAQRSLAGSASTQPPDARGRRDGSSRRGPDSRGSPRSRGSCGRRSCRRRRRRRRRARGRARGRRGRGSTTASPRANCALDPADAGGQQALAAAQRRAAPASTSACRAARARRRSSVLRAVTGLAGVRNQVQRAALGDAPAADARSCPSAMIMCVPAAVAILPASILVRMPPRDSSEPAPPAIASISGVIALDHRDSAARRVGCRRRRRRGRRCRRAGPAGRRRSWWRRARRAGRCRRSGFRWSRRCRSR